jgi:hypothetical protein
MAETPAAQPERADLSRGTTDALVAVVPRTGEPAVDAAGARLAELAGAEVHDHPAIFEAIHEQLTGVLDAAMNEPTPVPHANG